MSDLSVQLTAPNGVTYTQPTGLFINGEFVKAAKGGTITSIDPALVPPPPRSPALRLSSSAAPQPRKPPSPASRPRTTT